MIPHTRPGEWPPDISESRFASLIRRAPEGCRAALLGLPDDLGVRLNRGRPGAAAGPSAFRAALARYGIAHPEGWQWPQVFDAGDIEPAPGDDESALIETHRRITEAAAALAALNLVPIAIGGGHDLTLPFVRGVMQRHRITAGIYFDAHLDVRDTVGSGMPFRKLVEDCGIRSLRAFGIERLVNAHEHMAWFRANGGRLADEMGNEAWHLPLGDLFVSFDLDVIDAAFAPGVSAMNPCGWTPREAEEAIRLIAREPGVRCFDIMELCPTHDPGGRTARLAAHLFLTFLRGLGERR
ncbi:MAG: arginase family protein [Phycisphaerales bacterium]